MDTAVCIDTQLSMVWTQLSTLAVVMKKLMALEEARLSLSPFLCFVAFFSFFQWEGNPLLIPLTGLITQSSGSAQHIKVSPLFQGRSVSLLFRPHHHSATLSRRSSETGRISSASSRVPLTRLGGRARLAVAVDSGTEVLGGGIGEGIEGRGASLKLGASFVASMRMAPSELFIG